MSVRAWGMGAAILVFSTALWAAENVSAASAAVIRIRPNKILYHPDEAAVVAVTVSNAAATALKLEARLSEVTELDTRRVLGVRSVEAPARQAVTIEFAFTNSTIEYGRDLQAELVVDGKRVATATEPFSVADNVWKVAIGALPNGPASSSANYTDEQIVQQIRQFRDQCCNVWEKYFWASDDWGDLTPEPGATWFSAQARRHESTEKLKLQVDASRAQGIAVVTYGKCMAGGVPGWEMARARPQWFVTDLIGRTMGRPADVWDFDHWQESRKYEEYKYKWTYRWVDLRRLDALDHGINELIASTKQFGWDGVRFDSGGFRAHYVDGQYNGNDAVNTRNMKQTKERIRQAFPSYLFGYNTDNTVAKDGRAYPLTVAEMSHEMREMLAGGGLWMGEALKDFSNGGVQYVTWSQYARDERRCIQAIKQAGGHACYLFSYEMQSPVCNLYQFVIALTIGAHTYGGEHVQTDGSENWGRFMTRWSGLLWDSRLRALENADTLIRVTSPRPLWWMEFVNERVIGTDRRQVIVHLLNPPVDDEIAKVRKKLSKDILDLANAQDKKAGNDEEDLLNMDSSANAPSDSAVERPQLAANLLAAARAQRLPAPVSNCVVTVRVPAGQTPLTAWFIAPGISNRALEADWKKEGDQVVVAVPEFAVWAMVVCEFKGSFSAPAPLSPFSEALSEAETADLGRQVPKPADKMPSFGLRPPAVTPNLMTADDLKNPTPPPDASIQPVEVKPATVTAPDGLKVGGAAGLDVLVINGFYHAHHRVPEAVKAVRPDARITECTARNLPTDYVIKENADELSSIIAEEKTATEAMEAPVLASSGSSNLVRGVYQYDLIVLVDMGAEAWDANGQKRLSDFVQAGGRLAVLGGPFTLGQGYFKSSLIERVLPVEVRAAKDVYQLPAPLALGDREGKPFVDQPLLYYYHAVIPRPDATPLLWAGDLPILWERKVGKGSSVVFAGAPLGEPGKAQDTPFWKSRAWLEGFGRALVGPIGRE